MHLIHLLLSGFTGTFVTAIPLLVEFVVITAVLPSAPICHLLQLSSSRSTWRCSLAESKKPNTSQTACGSSLASPLPSWSSPRHPPMVRRRTRATGAVAAAVAVPTAVVAAVAVAAAVASAAVVATSVVTTTVVAAVALTAGVEIAAVVTAAVAHNRCRSSQTKVRKEREAQHLDESHMKMHRTEKMPQKKTSTVGRMREGRISLMERPGSQEKIQKRQGTNAVKKRKTVEEHLKDPNDAEREYHEAIKNWKGRGKVIGDLVFAQRQSKVQSTNKQTWIGECTDALEDCKAHHRKPRPSRMTANPKNGAGGQAETHPMPEESDEDEKKGTDEMGLMLREGTRRKSSREQCVCRPWSGQCFLLARVML